MSRVSAQETPLANRHLTKSRYLADLQCPRRLWLVVHEPLPYEEPDPGSPMDVGQEIGRKAHLLFPGGVLIDEEPWRHAEAAARTAALMSDARVPAIFEAAFEYDDIRVRVDVMERLADGAWGLREVKSSSGLKDHYLDDIALQAYVTRGAGVAVSSIELLHVNTAYVRGPDGICWAAFFARMDVGDDMAARLTDLPGRLPAMRDHLAMTDVPDVEPGKQCDSPYTCEFKDRCTADKPDDWVSRDATASGQPFVAPDLARLLHSYGPPACYLDFEAMMPPIPLYEGRRSPPLSTVATVSPPSVRRPNHVLATYDCGDRRQVATISRRDRAIRSPWYSTV
jgi:hypothetical protein